jgi:tetratricopeptide (TPR) repeat protein
LDAAEWARKQLGLDSLGYEENRNLARTLREYAKHEEATERFKLASSLEKYNWFSQWGLAACYAKQKEYSLAIVTVEDAINTIRCGDVKEDYESIPDLNRDLAQWYQDAGDTPKASAIYEKLLRENPDDYDVALDMTLLFHKNKNYNGLLHFLESLKNSMDESTGLDRRTQVFHAHYSNEDYHAAMFALVSDGEGFDAIHQSYGAAITAAQKRYAEGRKGGDIDEEFFAGCCLALLMHKLSLLCYEHSNENADRREFAIDQWVRVLQIEETSEGYYLAWVKNSVRTTLARVCYTEARRDPSASAPYLKRLEQLAAFGVSGDYEAYRSSTYPLELIARYHALQGDEQKAKDALRTHVKRNIDILSDDDPLNDWQGYQGLARYFMFAGQDADCLAAWSLIAPVDDTGTKSDSSKTEGFHELRGPLSDSCDGQCGRIWTYADDINVCRECDYMEFDTGCLNKLREGTLERQVCGKDHEFLRIPVYDPAHHQKVGEGNVLVGEEIIPVSDWLQGIKERWGIRT